MLLQVWGWLICGAGASAAAPGGLTVEAWGRSQCGSSRRTRLNLNPLPPPSGGGIRRPADRLADLAGHIDI